MGDRRCCCGGCFEFTDYFNRDDSDSLGADWTEDSGDWEVKSSHLYEPGTTGAFVRTTQLVPARSAGEMYVATTASYFVADQEFAIYAAYDHATGTYWKGTYRKIDSAVGGDWEVKLFKNGDLKDTKTMTPFPGFIDMEAGWATDTNHTRCWICVDSEGNAKAGVTSTGDEPCWSIENGGVVGRGAALGHPNAIDTYLDDFFMSELHDNTHECEACWCNCCGNLLSPRVTATITNAVDRAACLDGQSVDLVWDWDGGLQTRKGVLTYTRVSGGTTYTNTFSLRLSCAGNGEDVNCSGQNISLEIISNCARIGGSGGQTCSSGGCILTPNSNSTCDPLNLIYGPIYLDRGLLACTACYGFMDGPDDGTYYIVITE